VGVLLVCLLHFNYCQGAHIGLTDVKSEPTTLASGGRDICSTAPWFIFFRKNYLIKNMEGL
ncbi:MAG: hypothetical protein ACOZBL_00625, partial [Patescibacteria group bacterium]